MSATGEIINALTIDVEDYFHVTAFEGDVSRAKWHCYPQRVERNTHKILEILDEANTRATFYFVGWIADAYPQLVREIFDLGHEIGSHSYWHRLIYDLTPAEFRSDLRRSKQLLEDLVGSSIDAFRAPSFSITEKSLWSLDILAEEGFVTDSSVFPIYHDRYGIHNAPTQVHKIQTDSGDLLEFPPSVVKRMRFNLPVSGGGYFRLYPLSWTLKWLDEINENGDPFVFYFHPWEIDADQPRLRAGSVIGRIRHHLNLHRTEERFRTLLSRFSFDTIGHSLRCWQERQDAGINGKQSIVRSANSYS